MVTITTPKMALCPVCIESSEKPMENLEDWETVHPLKLVSILIMYGHV